MPQVDIDAERIAELLDVEGFTVAEAEFKRVAADLKRWESIALSDKVRRCYLKRREGK